MKWKDKGREERWLGLQHSKSRAPMSCQNWRSQKLFTLHWQKRKEQKKNREGKLGKMEHTLKYLGLFVEMPQWFQIISIYRIMF